VLGSEILNDIFKLFIHREVVMEGCFWTPLSVPGYREGGFWFVGFKPSRIVGLEAACEQNMPEN